MYVHDELAAGVVRSVPDQFSNPMGKSIFWKYDLMKAAEDVSWSSRIRE